MMMTGIQCRASCPQLWRQMINEIAPSPSASRIRASHATSDSRMRPRSTSASTRATAESHVVIPEDVLFEDEPKAKRQGNKRDEDVRLQRGTAYASYDVPREEQ